MKQGCSVFQDCITRLYVYLVRHTFYLTRYLSNHTLGNNEWLCYFLTGCMTTKQMLFKFVGHKAIFTIFTSSQVSKKISPMELHLYATITDKESKALKKLKNQPSGIELEKLIAHCVSSFNKHVRSCYSHSKLLAQILDYCDYISQVIVMFSV